MHDHPRSDMVQVGALSLLTHLTSAHAPSQRAAVAAGAGPALVEVIASAFGFSVVSANPAAAPATAATAAVAPGEVLQRKRLMHGELALASLINLAVSEDERVCAQLEAQGAIRAALGAVSAEPARINVQVCGLAFLERMLRAARDDADPEAMPRRGRTLEGAGGAKAALAALRASPGSVDVQIAGLRLINLLCCPTAVREGGAEDKSHLFMRLGFTLKRRAGGRDGATVFAGAHVFFSAAPLRRRHLANRAPVVTAARSSAPPAPLSLARPPTAGLAVSAR